MADWKDFLASIPIFSFLNREELKSIQDHFVEVTFQKGETVCRMGDPGDVFYVILSGELEVWGGEEELRRTGTLTSRDFFGEMALLQGGKRTATIIAARRTRTLALDKPSFDRFFVKNPRALEYFARVLCKRLASVTRGDTGELENLIVSIGAKPGLKGKSIVARSVGCLLKDFTHLDVLVVEVFPRSDAQHELIDELLSNDMEEIPAELQQQLEPNPRDPTFLSIGAKPGQATQFYADRVSNFVGKLSRIYNIVILDLGSEIPELIQAAGQFSDVVLEIADTPAGNFVFDFDASTRVYRIINRFNPTSANVPISHCEPFVLPDSPVLSDAEGIASVRASGRLPAAVPLHRLARKLVGATVGVALGGGAAFGISHLGVLKVLEENNVPIDLLAGCSQGSIIGVGYAAGLSTDEMIAIAGQLGRRKNFFMAMDFSLLGPGFLMGDRMIEIFTPYLGGRETFEDLVYPFRAIATDIESGERIALGSGRLTSAFRASASVPMVFSPSKHEGRALVDGGVSDPVPAETIQEMGADLCIAVNVVPPLKKGVTTVMNRAYKQVNRLNPLSYLSTREDLPNMFDIVMNSMQILQYELGNFKAISADVLINPDLSDFTWIEYYRSHELIDRGVEAAERALPAIEKALKEKVRTLRDPAR
ncbi:MAG: patatin-like phospholipase family protein [Acidobacteriota bacterium]